MVAVIIDFLCPFCRQAPDPATLTYVREGEVHTCEHCGEGTILIVVLASASGKSITPIE